jgi:transposase
MMGAKARVFTLVPAVSLDELVPADHFYRHLDRVLDLSFIRDLVQECYANCGRPSIDPMVFFKLQLVMFKDPNLPSALALRARFPTPPA